MNDWRIQGQENYLKDCNLVFKKFYKFSDTWDHEHCEFCWSKFSEFKDDLHQGYCTLDGKYWICEGCFKDFKDMFHWNVN